jgi:hypothetical protein
MSLRFSALADRAPVFVVVIWLSALPSSGQVSAANPFASLAGSWTGNGTIAMSSGAKERIRCRADYRPRAANTLHVALNCASDSYRFELESEVVAADGALSGTWSEMTRRVAGQIFGRMPGHRMEIRAEGPTFSALLDMTTRGGQQTVLIRSPGSEMSSVGITLERRSR